LKLPVYSRFPILLSPEKYRGELTEIARLYRRLSQLGLKVAAARELVQQTPAFKNKPADSIRIDDAKQALTQLPAEDQKKLRQLIQEIEAMDVGRMKAQLRAERYQIFLDHPSEFSALLPKLIDWFFNSFNADFTVVARTH
jgi:DNA-binding transcriptional MerR regulator